MNQIDMSLAPAGPNRPETLADGIDLIRVLLRPRRATVRYTYRDVVVSVHWGDERGTGYSEAAVRIVEHPYSRPLVDIPLFAGEGDVRDTIGLVDALDDLLDRAQRSAEDGVRS